MESILRISPQKRVNQLFLMWLSKPEVQSILPVWIAEAYEGKTFSPLSLKEESGVPPPSPKANRMPSTHSPRCTVSVLSNVITDSPKVKSTDVTDASIVNNDIFTCLSPRSAKGVVSPMVHGVVPQLEAIPVSETIASVPILQQPPPPINSVEKETVIGVTTATQKATVAQQVVAPFSVAETRTAIDRKSSVCFIIKYLC